MSSDKPKVLVVDDDSRILELLKQFFEKNGFDTYAALDAEEAELVIKDTEIDLLILDAMLPGVTGFEFARKIKESTRKTPIILLTALSDPDDRVRGLESGADDYITKPFDPRELILRAKNLLELYKANILSKYDEPYSFGECKYNVASKRLTIREEDIPLSSTEQKLLEHLLDNKGQAVSRENLSKIMGGLSDRSIDVQIVRLRQKIEEDAKQPKFLQTIRHQGYGIFF